MCSLELNWQTNLVRKLLLADFRSPSEHRLSLYLLVKAVIQRHSWRTLQFFCACPHGSILLLSPWRKLLAGTCAHGRNAALHKGVFSNGEWCLPRCLAGCGCPSSRGKATTAHTREALWKAFDSHKIDPPFSSHSGAGSSAMGDVRQKA